MNNLSELIYASLGGILPALIWLIFWLKEDSKKPEPSGRLVLTFCLGMAAVLIALESEKFAWKFFPYFGLLPFAIWAFFEEILKFGGAYFAALRSRDDDEPLDPVIYMITAALGFVALENTLFIMGALTNHELILLSREIDTALTTGGLRFIGASLLHVVASGTIGLALAVSFYKSRIKKVAYFTIGLITSVMIHALFNVSIYSQDGYGILKIFAVVWVAVAILLLSIERVKAIAPEHP